MVMQETRRTDYEGVTGTRNKFCAEHDDFKKIYKGADLGPIEKGHKGTIKEMEMFPIFTIPGVISLYIPNEMQTV